MSIFIIEYLVAHQFSDFFLLKSYSAVLELFGIKVARYSFSGSIPPKFEHKVRRHKKSFGKIATTVVLEKDENLL